MRCFREWLLERTLRSPVAKDFREDMECDSSFPELLPTECDEKLGVFYLASMGACTQAIAEFRRLFRAFRGSHE